MTLYDKIKNKTSVFFRLFGIQPENFERILLQLEVEYSTKIVQRYKRPGRPTKLDLCDQLLLILLYYRSNMSYFVMSFFFRLDAAQIGRAIRRLEPLLLDIIKLQKSQKISEEEASTLLIDATEQSISRPKKFQKSYYSGKKKSHTIKTQLVTTARGRILSVSRPYSGYQGLEKYLKNTIILPKKKTKNTSLNPEEKENNRKNSRIRVKIEHIFAQIKKFKILYEKYRGKIARYGLRTAIICGLVNIGNGFGEFALTETTPLNL